MAYKKYIKRGGKIYGPYIYHSKRIDGKVISEYRGSEKLDYKKIFLVIFGVIFLVAMAFILIFSEREMTGKAVLNLDADYQQGEVLEGKLKLSLQEGELIPASSKLVVENNGNIFEYELKDLVSDELNEGNFYIEGTSLSGFGEGYGIPGRKEIHPPVYFVLNILSQEESSVEQTDEPEQINESQETEIIQTENITEEAPITGNIISGFAGAISDFFLGLTMTGKAVVEFEREVYGQVSVNEDFVYTLQEEERAELKPRSVKTDSGQLSDNDIDLRIENNQIMVTTNYSELEEGFGEEHLGDGSKEFIIAIPDLNLILEQGSLKVSIIDSNQEILSLSTVLEEGEVIANETVLDSTPETSEPDLTIETDYEIEEKEIYVPELVVSLTEQERMILFEKFGNTLTVKEASPKRGFINVRYEFSSEYWVEFNYDVSLSEEILELFRDRDLVKWLKDIAKSLSETPEIEEEVLTSTRYLFD